jgi:hypothetical protein
MRDNEKKSYTLLHVSHISHPLIKMSIDQLFIESFTLASLCLQLIFFKIGRILIKIKNILEFR